MSLSLAVAELGDLSPARVRAIAHSAGPSGAAATVRTILDALDTNAAAYPTVAAMVACSGYSERHFGRLVEALTGVTAQQYLTAVRLHQAQQLLALTDLPLHSVAVRVGYRCHAGLGMLFAREVGMTPADYRKRVK